MGRLLHDHHLRRAAGDRLRPSTRRRGSTAHRSGRSPCGSRSRWSRRRSLLILVFALIGTLQFFNEPKILQQLAARHDPATTSRRTCTPISRPSRYANFNYGVGDLVRAGRRRLHLRLHLPVRHPQARERPLMTVTPASTSRGRRPPGRRDRARRRASAAWPHALTIVLGAADDLLPDPVLVADREQLEERGRAVRRRAARSGSPTTSTTRRTSRPVHLQRRHLRAVAGQLAALRGRRWRRRDRPGGARRLRLREVPLRAAAGSTFAILLGAVMVPTDRARHPDLRPVLPGSA